MHHLVAHREHEHGVEVPLERAFEIISRFAIYVAGLTLQLCVGL